MKKILGIGIVACFLLTTFMYSINDDRFTEAGIEENSSHTNLSFIGIDPHSWNGITKDFSYLSNFSKIGINFYGLENFGWHGIQPDERGSYEWEEFDPQVKAIEDIGGEILFKIWSGSTWASTIFPVRGVKGNRALPSSPIKEEYIEDFKKFVKAVVERYDGDGIDDMPGLKKPHLFYQFEGEPDSFFPECDCMKKKVSAHWCGTPKEYNYLVKMFHDAVKEANQNAVILSPSPMFNDIFNRNFDEAEFNQIVNNKSHTDSYKRYIFIKTLFSEPDNFDVVAIQGNKNYEGILPWVRWVKEQVPNKDIWIADAAAGYIYSKHMYSHEKYENEDMIEEALRSGDKEIVKKLGFKDYNELLWWALAEQSKNVFKKIVIAADAGVKHIFLQWPFESEDPIKGWVNVGLLEDDFPKSGYPFGTPRPVFYSTRQFMEKIGNFDSVVDLNPLPKGVDPINWTWIIKFTEDNKDVFIAWSDDGEKTIDLSSYISTPYVKITHIVTELDANNNPIYPYDEIVPTNSIPIDETPIFVETPFQMNVTITKPEECCLYIFDRKIIPISGNTIILGKITVEVDVYILNDIEKVEFYIDDILKNTDTEALYSWTWNEKAIGRHEIKVIAYDNKGNKAEDKIDLITFNLW